MAKYVRTVGVLSALALLAGCSSGMAVPSKSASSSSSTKGQSSSASPSSAKSTTTSKSPSTFVSKASSTAPKPTVSSAAPSSAGKAYLKDGVVYGTVYSYKLPANYTFEVAEQGDDSTIKYNDGDIVIFTSFTLADTPGDTGCSIRDKELEDAKAKSGSTEVSAVPDIILDGVTACGLVMTKGSNSLIGYFAVKSGVLFYVMGQSSVEAVAQRDADLASVAKSWSWKKYR